MGKFKPGYYAVAIERKKGIYLTWEECDAQVSKFPNARYRKFYMKKDAEEFIANNQKSQEITITMNKNSLKVWTDAGIGVFWEINDSNNLSECVPGAQTNNRAEIYAVIRAIETCKNNTRPLEIMTDSKYVIKSVETWIKKWEQNGWLTKNNTEVKNKDLFIRLKNLIDNRVGSTKLIFVKGHEGIYSNEKADKLAKEGSLKNFVENINNVKPKITDFFNKE
ncbi:9145_t:CDS:2 [Gigaspora margarita]|uniref:ribonuclease H n=1 Tax=Gigaspora margarita TaxID=4874 RepID=A0ABM8VZ02_GIGMA|nr:9145_t:CDS:2 [Gigaspora margarita]